MWDKEWQNPKKNDICKKGESAAAGKQQEVEK